VTDKPVIWPWSSLVPPDGIDDLRAEVERLRAEVAYIVALLDPLVGGDGAPVQALVRRIAARASASAGAIPSGEAVR